MATLVIRVCTCLYTCAQYKISLNVKVRSVLYGVSVLVIYLVYWQGKVTPMSTGNWSLLRVRVRWRGEGGLGFFQDFSDVSK